MIRTPVSTWEFLEDAYRSRGHRYIAGVDEAGRGPLAGPVVAAAVVVSEGSLIPGVRDSKQLTARQRDELYRVITSEAVSWAVGIVGPREIEQWNILQATLQAMRMAISSLVPPPDFLLVDGPSAVPTEIAQECVIHGDERCYSIAAASIVAKVTRDRLMLGYHQQYPQYNFAEHKGYATPGHIDAIRKFGYCEIHRTTFRGVVDRWDLFKVVEEECE